MQDSQASFKKTNGVLPVPVSNIASETTSTTKPSKTKTPIVGDKVVIRRLPPGLLEEELWSILGDQWKPGNGMVDWANFQAGKVPQDTAKAPKPSRAYLHVKKPESLAELSEIVQTKAWEDAKLTYANPALLGQPIVEASIYKKIPSSRKRTDTRQGTIDQDPEFMSFLQSLTNPELDNETSTGEAQVSSDETKPEKVTTTPLIEYLKEKKANKSKDAAAAKSGKHARQESQNSKAKGTSSTNDEVRKSKKEKDAKTTKASEKPRETVKILTKKATADAAKAAESVAREASAAPAAQEQPKSRRANIAAAARILQRDLGLSPGSAHRRARLNAAKSDTETKAASPTEPSGPTAEAAPTAATADAVVQSTDRPPTPTTAKQSRSRRGKQAANVNANGTEAKAKAPDGAAATTNPTPSKAPIVLLKKKDKDTAPASSSSTKPSPVAEPANSSSAGNPPTGPKPTPAKGSAATKKSASATVTAGCTRGFVKHANPSQGITETLLKQTMECFGVVTFVEIDRRKGFAYVDFAEHEALVKAVTASPISVAQGTVQVLERKEKKQAGTSGGPSASTPSASTQASTSSQATPDASENTGPRRNRRGRGGGGGGKGAGQGNAGAGGASQRSTGAPASSGKSAG